MKLYTPVTVFFCLHSDVPENKMKKLGHEVQALGRLLDELETCVGRQKEQLNQFKVTMEACGWGCCCQFVEATFVKTQHLCVCSCMCRTVSASIWFLPAKWGHFGFSQDCLSVNWMKERVRLWVRQLAMRAEDWMSMRVLTKTDVCVCVCLRILKTSFRSTWRTSSIWVTTYLNTCPGAKSHQSEVSLPF